MTDLKPQDRRRRWPLFAQAAVALALLLWVFSDDSLRSDIGRTISEAHIWPLALGVFAAGLGILANILRWWIFLRIFDIHVPPTRLAGIFLIGMAFGMLGLGALGADAARAVLLMRDRPRRKGPIVLSIIADHFSAVVALSMTAATLAVFRFDWYRATAIGTTALSLTLVFAAASLVLFALSVLAAVDHQRRLLPRFIPCRDWIIAFSDRLAPLAKHWRGTALACLLSFPVLHFHFLTFYSAALAFDAELAVGDIFGVMPIVEMATALPISFSGLGVREGLFKELLGAMAGTPAAVAVLISLAGFACTLFWGVVGAVIIPFWSKRRRAH